MTKIRKFLDRLKEKQKKESAFDPVSEKLDPEIWKGDKLKGEVKKIVLDKLFDWLESQDVKKESVISVNLLGSIAGYQYNATSDLDVNVIIDVKVEKRAELQKLMPNGELLKDTKHPINYYLADKFRDEWKKTTNGIYDLMKDDWVKKPEKVKTQPMAKYNIIVEISRFFIAGFAMVISEYESDVAAYETLVKYKEGTKDKKDLEDIDEKIKNKVDEIVADIESAYIAKHVLWALRNEAFSGKAFDINLDIKDMDANLSLNNLIYKFVESAKYLEKIKEVTDNKDRWVKVQGK